MSAAGHGAEQFDSPAQQHEAALLGMWVFLATEVLFFGALFVSYFHYRNLEAAAFAAGSRHSHIWIGTANTALLLTSGLFMALCVRAARAKEFRALPWLLVATAALGAAFLALKGLEYSKEWHEGLVPALRFTYAGPYPDGVAMFYTLYWIMTGVHAIHLAIGVALVGWLVSRSLRGDFTPAWHTPVEVVALYWGFVDIVWIFLYPLIYLMDRYR